MPFDLGGEGLQILISADHILLELDLSHSKRNHHDFLWVEI